MWQVYKEVATATGLCLSPVWVKCFAMWTWPSYTQVSVNAHTCTHMDTHMHMRSHMDTDNTAISGYSKKGRRGGKSYSSFLHIFLHCDCSCFLLASSCFLHLWPDDLHLLCAIRGALLDTHTLLISLLFHPAISFYPPIFPQILYSLSFSCKTRALFFFVQSFNCLREQCNNWIIFFVISSHSHMIHQLKITCLPLYACLLLCSSLSGFWTFLKVYHVTPHRFVGLPL